MTAIKWVIPPSTLRWLEDLPLDRPIAMLIRHSVRGYLPPGEVGYMQPITEEGHRLALELGLLLHGRLQSVHASPLLRTMQTATCLATGAGFDAVPVRDTLLGDPGIYVVDARAGDSWARLGYEEVMRHLVGEKEPLPGCAAPEPAARFLVYHMLSKARAVPGIHVFVTHDSLVTATAARLLRELLSPNDWPWYLEAAFFWNDGDQVHTAYRDWHSTLPAPLVGPLSTT